LHPAEQTAFHLFGEGDFRKSPAALRKALCPPDAHSANRRETERARSGKLPDGFISGYCQGHTPFPDFGSDPLTLWTAGDQQRLCLWYFGKEKPNLICCSICTVILACVMVR